MRIEKVCLTKENLLKIQDLDDSFYKNNITGINWYLERYNKNHFAYVLVDENGNYGGYVMGIPIKREFYDAITNGVITNDLYINPKMFVNESNYYYIYSIIIQEKYRNKGYGTKLLEKLLNDIENKNYCVLTISKNGYNLFIKYLDIKIKINNDMFVFINKDLECK